MKEQPQETPKQDRGRPMTTEEKAMYNAELVAGLDEGYCDEEYVKENWQE